MSSRRDWLSLALLPTMQLVGTTNTSCLMDWSRPSLDFFCLYFCFCFLSWLAHIVCTLLWFFECICYLHNVIHTYIDTYNIDFMHIHTYTCNAYTICTYMHRYMIFCTYMYMHILSGVMGWKTTNTGSWIHLCLIKNSKKFLWVCLVDCD